MNEDYLDSLLNSVKDSEADDKNTKPNDNSETVDAESMDALLESVSTADAGDVIMDVTSLKPDEADEELLGVESQNDISADSLPEAQEVIQDVPKDVQPPDEIIQDAGVQPPDEIIQDAGVQPPDEIIQDAGVQPPDEIVQESDMQQLDEILQEAQGALESIVQEAPNNDRITEETAQAAEEAVLQGDFEEEPLELDDSISIEDLFGGAQGGSDKADTDGMESVQTDDDALKSGNMLPDEDIISRIDMSSDMDGIEEVEDIEDALSDKISLDDEPESDIGVFNVKEDSEDKSGVVQTDAEAQSDKNKSGKSDKSGIGAFFRKVFFKEVRKEDEILEEPKDENEQVLQELYGKDTAEGELLSEKNKKKKGPFAKFKAGMKERKEKALEEERLEEEAEELELQEKKRKKEEKKAAAQEKKEAAKAAKEENKAKKGEEKAAKAAKAAAKPKKEKKPKKPKKPTNPKDILKIKPMSVLMFFILVASFVLMIVMLNSVLDYSQNISRVKGYMQNGNYSAAYRIMHGMELSKNDENLHEQLRIIMTVERQYESYQNYKQLGMNVEALNALIKGLVQYDDYKQKGEEIGVITPMNDTRQVILDTLLSEYKIDEKLASDLVALFNKDFTRYYRSIETYGGTAG